MNQPKQAAGAREAIFGRRLRQAREWSGLSQEQLGAAIGVDEFVSSARISRYETGVHEPAILIAQQLAKALDVPLAFLYCKEDQVAKALLHLHRCPASDRNHWLAALDARWPERPERPQKRKR